MDTRTGNILMPDQFAALSAEERRGKIAMRLDPTTKQLARKPPKVGRNEECPCGSGKKFKRCCLFREPKP